jgi:hypothetical protein
MNFEERRPMGKVIMARRKIKRPSKRPPGKPARLVVEPDGETQSGPCPCCGTWTKTLWGFIHRGDETIAAYYVSWTLGHTKVEGATFEFIIGQWTEESAAEDRQLVALAYRMTPKGAGFMVIDAKKQERGDDELVSKALKRSEVIGTPLAAEVFALGDAVCLDDPRLAELRQWPKEWN